MESPQVLEVTIFGEKYKLISTYKDQERILKISNLVDDRMESLAQRFPKYPKAKIAILTSLNLADELFRLHGDQEKTNDKVDSILSFLDHTLPQSE